MESSELSDCSIGYLAAAGRGGTQLRSSADMALFFFQSLSRTDAVDLPICDCPPYWPLRSVAPTPRSHCQQPSNPPSFGPIHKKNDALSAEKRDRLSLQPSEDSLQFQRWARLQNALVICLDAHSSRMMAVSVDTSIVTGSQPFLAGGVVARTDLVWLNSQNDCRSNGSGLHRCLSNPSGRERLSLL